MVNEFTVCTVVKGVLWRTTVEDTLDSMVEAESAAYWLVADD